MMISILDRGKDDGDPIDAQLSMLGAAPTRLMVRRPWYARFALGWASGTSPMLLLLIGAALGPGGLSLLSPGILSAIDPAVPVALAALGVHLALHVDLTPAPARLRRLAAATAGVALAFAVVAVGLLRLMTNDLTAAPFHAWVIALSGAVCAGMSLPIVDSGRVMRDFAGTHRLELMVSIVAGGLVLGWIREGSLADAFILLGQMAALPIVVGVAAWLLVTHTAPETEQRIFALASLLLVGGLADYLSMSALFSGMMAGVLWRLVPGAVGEAVLRDITHLRHPLAAFLMLIVGARVTMAADLTLLLGYPLLAIAGGFAARAVITRLAGPVTVSPDERQSVAPAVFPVAFALSTGRAAGPQTDLLLGVVAIGTIALQVVSALRQDQEPAS
jgi:hypothetical protein